MISVVGSSVFSSCCAFVTWWVRVIVACMSGWLAPFFPSSAFGYCAGRYSSWSSCRPTEKVAASISAISFPHLFPLLQNLATKYCGGCCAISTVFASGLNSYHRATFFICLPILTYLTMCFTGNSPIMRTSPSWVPFPLCNGSHSACRCLYRNYRCFVCGRRLVWPNSWSPYWGCQPRPRWHFSMVPISFQTGGWCSTVIRLWYVRHACWFSPLCWRSINKAVLPGVEIRGASDSSVEFLLVVHLTIARWPSIRCVRRQSDAEVDSGSSANLEILSCQSIKRWPGLQTLLLWLRRRYQAEYYLHH